MKCMKPRTKDKAQSRLTRWMMAMTVAAMTAVSALSVMGSMSVQAEETLPLPQRDGRVALYVMDQPGLDLSDDAAQHMDQLNYAFALLEGGKATGSHWRSAEEVRRYLNRHPHITGVMAVGGWGAEGFSDACATEEGRKTLADSILRLMDRYGFTGVDIDWEYPGSSAAGIKSREEDVENWYELLTLLRQGLDQRETETGREYILSVALGAGEAQLNAVDGSRLDKLVDQAVVMAYDLTGFDRLTGHHAGLYPDKNIKNSGAYAVRRITDSGLSSEKVLLGIPAYGRMWRQVLGGGNGLNVHAGTAGNRILRYDELQKLELQDYRRFYDEKAQAAWWYDGENFVSGEDSLSVKAKCDWLRDNGLQGAAVWAAHQDPEGTLLAEISAALTDHFGAGETGGLPEEANTAEND
ncbi:MAG: hypothetical protein IJ507_06175 [Clostridia bacterium]|nr:hypothetical protein [Clostridia bacterium]